MFGHIRGSKHALKTQDELQRIKSKIKSYKQIDIKQKDDDKFDDEYTKFYSIPKKNSRE